jgi:hypothetical protein
LIIFASQEAERRSEYRSLPDVLMVQLTRFRYDYDKDRRVKINDAIDISDTLQVPFHPAAAGAAGAAATRKGATMPKPPRDVSGI